MEDLQRWGWNAIWAERFAPHLEAGCVPGRISVEHRGLYHFHGPNGEGVAQVSGRLRHLALGRADFPAVGDWVALRTSADITGPAMIEAILPRTNKLSRKAAGESCEEQILAANLDVLFLVTSLNLDLNSRRLERFLTAAALPDCQTVIILTKSDLCESPDAIVEGVRGQLGVPVHPVSALAGEGLDSLAPYLTDGLTVAMLGSSGVGKSTLLNRLAGLERQAVSAVREDDDRGRHTTTRRELVALPQGGLLIDSPGIRELQLWADSADVDAAFEDVARLAEGCPFTDCSHEHEPRCAVRQAIADGTLGQARYESFLKLRRELAYEEARSDGRAARERKELERRIHRTAVKQYRQQKKRKGS